MQRAVSGERVTGCSGGVAPTTADGTLQRTMRRADKLPRAQQRLGARRASGVTSGRRGASGAAPHRESPLRLIPSNLARHA